MLFWEEAKEKAQNAPSGATRYDDNDCRLWWWKKANQGVRRLNCKQRQQLVFAFEVCLTHRVYCCFFCLFVCFCCIFAVNKQHIQSIPQPTYSPSNFKKKGPIKKRKPTNWSLKQSINQSVCLSLKKSINGIDESTNQLLTTFNQCEETSGDWPLSIQISFNSMADFLWRYIDSQLSISRFHQSMNNIYFCVTEPNQLFYPSLAAITSYKVWTQTFLLECGN